ncbi:MAG: SPOR domain-containing protein [bacterium]|nr:SPOR domain-containing protein [bacterium]
MFEKLKNIKFSFKKKKKDEGESTAEDVFSSAEDDNFFSEPSFAEDDGSTDDLFGEAGGEDESTGDIAAGMPEDRSFEEKDKSTPVKGKSNAKRTFLLFLLLLLFSSYAAYTYILPDNYPELKRDIDSKSANLMQMIGPKVDEIISQVTQLISGKDAPENIKTPTRIAIQKPPKKAIPKPTAKEKEQTTKAIKEPVEKEVIKAIPEIKQKAVKEELVEPTLEVKEVEKKPASVSPIPVAKPKPKKDPAPVVKAEPATKKIPSNKKITVVKARLPVSEKGYYIQAGAFIFKDNLNIPRKKIESLGFKPKVKTGTKLIGMHRLLVGEWNDFLIAEEIADKLRRKGFKAELTSKDERFCVLIGSYYYRQEAERKKKALISKGFNSRIEKKRIKMKINYLLLGPYATSEKAAETTEVLNTKGLKTVIIQTK